MPASLDVIGTLKFSLAADTLYFVLVNDRGNALVRAGNDSCTTSKVQAKSNQMLCFTAAVTVLTGAEELTDTEFESWTDQETQVLFVEVFPSRP